MNWKNKIKKYLQLMDIDTTQEDIIDNLVCEIENAISQAEDDAAQNAEDRIYHEMEVQINDAYEYGLQAGKQEALEEMEE